MKILLLEIVEATRLFIVTIGGIVFAAACIYALAAGAEHVADDAREYPHSGYCPDSPTWERGAAW